MMRLTVIVVLLAVAAQARVATVLGRASVTVSVSTIDATGKRAAKAARSLWKKVRHKK